MMPRTISRLKMVLSIYMVFIKILMMKINSNVVFEVQFFFCYSVCQSSSFACFFFAQTYYCRWFLYYVSLLNNNNTFIKSKKWEKTKIKKIIILARKFFFYLFISLLTSCLLCLFLDSLFLCVCVCLRCCCLFSVLPKNKIIRYLIWTKRNQKKTPVS
jgi:hypothetical protein